MKIQFDDPLFEAWTQRPILTIAEGGAEIGEIKATAARIPEGDRDAWYREWTVTADRLYAQAEECAVRGARISARYLYQRASTYYNNPYPLLFGRPIDQRVKSGYAREAEAFARAAALFDPPITPVAIPFESVTLPGWFYSGGVGHRPLLICTNGYDATIQTMHYGSAAAAQRRGHHVLTFDGPGQGRVLIENGILMRPDWETVVRAVVDFALTLPGVDHSRIALAGWSFGGYLAPRAASGEPRLAALIADPGQWDLIEAFRAANIRCPTLVTRAESDPVAARARRHYDALTGPKTFIRCTAAEGAGDHCEASARSVYIQRAYDWLDGVLGD